MLNKIKKIISGTCIAFTVAEFFIMIVAELMLKNEATSDTVVSFLQLRASAVLLAALFLINAASLIFELKSLPRVVQRILHYVAVMLCAVLVGIVIPGKLAARFVFTFVVLCTLVYVVVVLILFVIKKAVHRSGRGDETYEPVYKSEKKNG